MVGSPSPFYLAAKSIDDQTLLPNSNIAIATCVGYDSNQVSTAGGDVRGIARSDGYAGVALNVAVMGTVAARVGAAITAVGTQLTSDASGRLVPATSGQTVFARALQTATASDQYIEIFITREGKA